MVTKPVAGVAVLQKASYYNELAESATIENPAKTAGNPSECRTSNLREKLRQIRDSDHPASPWARNVVQIMDDLQGLPDDPFLLKALGRATAMFEQALHGSTSIPPDTLTADEIASIFGLGTHQH